MKQGSEPLNFITYGILFGAALGIIISSIFSINVGLGIAIGAALGIVAGSAFDGLYRRRNH